MVFRFQLSAAWRVPHEGSNGGWCSLGVAGWKAGIPTGDGAQGDERQDLLLLVLPLSSSRLPSSVRGKTVTKMEEADRQCHAMGWF